MSDLMKINILTGIKNVDDPRHMDIHEQLRRKLEEGNAAEYWERVEMITPGAANTEFLVTLQTLNRIPKYYIVDKKDKAVDVYTGATAWSRNKMYLKATEANATISILVVG